MVIGRLILGAVVALGLAGWGVYTVRLQQADRQLVLALEADRQRTVNDVAFHANQAQTFLGKALATGSISQAVRYLSNVQQHAVSAGNAYSQLPLNTDVGARGARFVQQIGDLAASFANREAAGQELTAKDRTLLMDVKTKADAISADLSTTLSEFTGRGQRMVQPVALTPRLLMHGYRTEAKAPVGGATPISYTTGGFSTVTDTNQGLPTLIYDGPFSEHVSKEAPRMTGAAITLQQAEAKLSQYLPMGPNVRVVSRSETAGKIPTFSFTLQRTGAPETFHVDIAKNGGYLVQMLNSRPFEESTLDLQAAKAKGLAFLAKLGINNMVPTYGVAEGGSATIAFAWSEGDVTYYRDQVKLIIALDNGEVVGFDARQYVTAHHDRPKLTPTVAAKTAQAKVNQGLAVRRVQLVAIPDNSGTGEILCWEFTGKMGDQDYLVYINASSGHEQQILQLIESDQGSFTI